MEEFERQRGNLLLDKALAVIWNEIHRLHDDIEFMMDLIRNVKEHVDQALPPFNLSHPPISHVTVSDPFVPPSPGSFKVCVKARKSAFGCFLVSVICN